MIGSRLPTRRWLPRRRTACAAVALAALGAWSLAMAAEVAGRSADDTALTGLTRVPAPLNYKPTRSTRAGLRLMTEAVAASRSVSYQGVQLVSWWGPGDADAAVIEVWHRPGLGTVAERAGDSAATTRGAVAAGTGRAVAAQWLGGIVGVSAQLLPLLEDNFRIIYAGRGRADGRPAYVVEAVRPGNRVAARFWLDAVTKLPLRRELFNGHARIVGEEQFVSLKLGHLAGMPTPAHGPPMRQLSTTALRRLRSAGWPLPATLGDRLVPFSATEGTGPSGPAVSLAYSDGLSVISLFVQRGELAHRLAGWQALRAHGHVVYALGRQPGSLAWSASGFVFTLVADAPPGLVERVIARLPHEDATGFWGRMLLGLRRIARVANPFR